MAADEPIPDEWRDELSPRWRPYVDELEDRLEQALRRLERSRQRARRLRAVNRDLKARLAAREKAPR